MKVDGDRKSMFSKAEMGIGQMTIAIKMLENNSKISFHSIRVEILARSECETLEKIWKINSNIE